MPSSALFAKLQAMAPALSGDNLLNPISGLGRAAFRRFGYGPSSAALHAMTMQGHGAFLGRNMLIGSGISAGIGATGGFMNNPGSRTSGAFWGGLKGAAFGAGFMGSGALGLYGLGRFDRMALNTDLMSARRFIRNI